MLAEHIVQQCRLYAHDEDEAAYPVRSAVSEHGPLLGHNDTPQAVLFRTLQDEFNGEEEQGNPHPL